MGKTEIQDFVAKMTERGYLDRLNRHIEANSKNPTRKGPICQARIDGWKAAQSELLAFMAGIPRHE